MHACLIRDVGVWDGLGWAGQGAPSAAHQRSRPMPRRSTMRGGCSASCLMRWGTATRRECTTGTSSQRMYCSAQVSARRHSRYTIAIIGFSSTCSIMRQCCEWVGTGRQPLAHRRPGCLLARPPCLPAHLVHRWRREAVRFWPGGAAKPRGRRPGRRAGLSAAHHVWHPQLCCARGAGKAGIHRGPGRRLVPG
jgi:hypothetical protein